TRAVVAFAFGVLTAEDGAGVGAQASMSFRIPWRSSDFGADSASVLPASSAVDTISGAQGMKCSSALEGPKRSHTPVSWCFGPTPDAKAVTLFMTGTTDV